MKFNATPLPGAMLVELQPHEDERGFFERIYCEREFAEHGLPGRMVQANVSFTRRAGTLRGMHWQAAPHEEDKLVHCLQGAIWDVIVDIRPGSPTYCRWFGVELGGAGDRMLLVPKGFAHGFVTLTDDASVLYHVSQFHAPGTERGARHDDPAFGIDWPVPIRLIADKDRAWPDFAGNAQERSSA
ncbi:dTDP-4-dehydrorhamnose 3,5-epimerase [Ramlibacter humi]|uniref:dTDP-4-dehydrorhamnose 3,5-epimerase n=1 Tax=Ramlibacter humi TaxID=2530451 RepID=A0A4Z0CC83_9BURK|nr:dTDP-4-dehydrorhamnose 3,5-epimerase [Ramlibacter humi]TFZ08068.1 dTDP-4-dehydrorhamnose 3,5-epimerase [Ramlibacter humi]